MQIKSILAGAAIALAATAGAATADEATDFSLLANVPSAIPISSGQAGKVFAAGVETYFNFLDNLTNAKVVSNGQALNLNHSYSSTTGGIGFVFDVILANPS